MSINIKLSGQYSGFEIDKLYPIIFTRHTFAIEAFLDETEWQSLLNIYSSKYGLKFDPTELYGFMKIYLGDVYNLLFSFFLKMYFWPKELFSVIIDYLNPTYAISNTVYNDYLEAKREMKILLPEYIEFKKLYNVINSINFYQQEMRDQLLNKKRRMFNLINPYLKVMDKHFVENILLPKFKNTIDVISPELEIKIERSTLLSDKYFFTPIINSEIWKRFKNQVSTQLELKLVGIYAGFKTRD